MFVGAGKLGLPDNAVVAFALGADMVNVGREAMLAIGCIQAQKCHTDTCPTGVATQDKWLGHGLDPTLKTVRVANYVKTLRRDLFKVSEAAGVEHPGPDRLRPRRDPRRESVADAAARGVRLRAGLGLPLRRRPARDHTIDDRYSTARRFRSTVSHRCVLKGCCTSTSPGTPASPSTIVWLTPLSSPWIRGSGT